MADMVVGEIRLVYSNDFEGYDPTGCHDDLWWEVIQMVSDEGYPDEQIRTLYRSREKDEAYEFYKRRSRLDVSEFTCADCCNRAYVTDYVKSRLGQDYVACFYCTGKCLSDKACVLFNKRGVK